MDILMQELQKKRQCLSEETGGRKVFKRSEIEQKRIQKRREEEKRDAEAKHLSQNPNKKQNGQSLSDPNSSSNFNLDSAKASPSDSLCLPNQEVIRRLRLLKEPVSLFGESDDDRLDRLNSVLQSGLFELDDSDMAEGQRNDFLLDILELKRRQKSDMNQDGVLKRMKTNFSELCDEDKILIFFNKLLIEWRQELDEMTEREKRTAKGKSKLAIFKQCARYLNPLFKFCRKKVVRDDIRQALMQVVDCCMKGDYSAASDHYIQIAIGKSAWPIGVTMVGIHERSAREKIYTNSVAHVMNDETTRKYLTSVKRLITFCERRHPATPSEAMEFNGLANCSVFQALLT